MSLIVTLFCIANALTLAAPLVDPTSSNSTSALVINPIASTKQRSTWEILWTCLATIFACTWVSIHPNIPSSKDGRMHIALQRLELMVWAILTPEMIIFWAMRQWRRHCGDMPERSPNFTKVHCQWLDITSVLILN